MITPRGALILAHAAVETLAISGPAVVDAARGSMDHARNDARLREWSGKLLGRVQVRVHAEGEEHLPRDGAPCIVMSNHQSLYDIPVLFVALPIRMRMVAKAELFRVPLWGRAMRVSGFIELDRGNREKAKAALDRAKALMIEEHISVWIAPEGTRSRDGSLGSFKQGGFHLALDTGLPILPVGIRGTHDLLQKGGREVTGKQDVRVRIGALIDPKSYGQSRRAELVQATRQSIAALSA